MLCACAGPQRAPIRAAPHAGVDFSGAWALDYGQSDNIQTRLNGLVRELRRDAERRAQAGGELRSPGAALMVGGGGGTDSGASVIGLARMADLITQSQMLDIEQTPARIRVKREESFALGCDFHDGVSTVVETPLGSEFCGWDGHQLLFSIALPEGLSIRHRLTLGPDGQRLQIATTVISDRVSYPFTLNRVYQRMEEGESGYRCKQTLTRGRVCTTESS
ncbi:hypothetical protein G3T16_19550 [Kineobactrum salinum]|uniref:Uncharacterized protein n=1 Tax=Kineobactrum salinum TaxID=2708301 RepID=A0A6C0U700_9GAMM|nr:hypothetical protein G3T16_19550 [Kineobactrum salinum]